MVTRVANVSDVDRILMLEEQVFELHSKSRPDWIGKNPLSYEYIESIVNGDNGMIFIAEVENQVVGHCIVFIREIRNHHLFHDMINIEVDDLCVDEKYRKKGIGKKLFEEVEKLAKEKGIKFIELNVWEFNQDAKGFYEHLGMKTRLNRMELMVE